MGIQTMVSHGSPRQQWHLRPALERQNSWYSLPLDEVENQLGKPLGSMNLDELLNTVWTAEAANANQSTGGMAIQHSASSSLQRQASITLVRAFSGKTVNEVWTDIKQGQKMRNMENINNHENEPTLGETTLEDFLVEAGIFAADASLEPSMGMDNALIPSTAFTPQPGFLSPSTSTDALSDTSMPGRKRNGAYAIEKTLERRLRRKIKNRESAARSRARRQAYHNELVTKVSSLEEDNLKLRKEKELDKMLSCELSPEPRYQLRRTTSF